MAAPAVPLSGSLPLGWPVLVYGLRLWASVCLALFVAFALELQNPYWAGTTAAIVCQPVLGASLRKGWFRLIGTVVGAVAGVVLTACFPQSRAGFLIGLALWGAACAVTATLLRNFASYAAALAGYTCIIIAGDELGTVGGASGDAFALAVTRASEISIGIVCAGFVLATTDLGGSRRRLARTLCVLVHDISMGVADTLEAGPGAESASQAARSGLFRRLVGLPVLMDQAAGEMSFMRFRPRTLQSALDGLFIALSSWRVIAVYREQTPDGAVEAAGVLAHIPARLRMVDVEALAADPLGWRAVALATARDLVGMTTSTASLRLLADRSAQALIGLAGAVAGVALLLHPERAEARPRVARIRVPDLLPSVVNGVRAFATIIVAELVWIETAWPSGVGLIMFAAITVILFAPREDAAIGMARNFMVGTAFAATFAAVVEFAVLPMTPTFGGLCVALGLVLVPAGAMSAQSWRQPLFTAAAANFIPLLGPANIMTYDPNQFYNTAIGLLAGVGLALLALRLIPPVPPALRARRLLTLTLRDLRRFAGGHRVPSLQRWEDTGFGRLAVLPESPTSLQHRRLAAIFALGSEIIRLHRAARRATLPEPVGAALQAIARGDSATALECLGRLEAERPAGKPAPARAALRLHATVLAVRQTLSAHAEYLDAPAPP